MTVWFTADLHLGHGNIIKYANRPFMTPEEQERVRVDPRGAWALSAASVERHDAALIDAINARVEPGDVLWVLGDFCLKDVDRARAYRERIRCRTVKLVRGNHDSPRVLPLFDEVLEQGMIKVEDQSIWLNHYPMRSWRGSFRGSWHLYGHVHGALAAEDAALGYTLTRDVGVDACGFVPLSFEDLRAYMAPRVASFEARRAAFVAGEAGVGALT